LICNVNDDPSLVRSSSTSVLNFNNTNLPAFETPRRVERIVPPMGFWNTYGVGMSHIFDIFDFVSFVYLFQFMILNVGKKN